MATKDTRGVLRRTMSWVKRTLTPGPPAPKPGPARDADWAATLKALRWQGNTLIIEGWAYDRGADYGDQQPLMEVWAEGAGGETVPAAVRITPSPEPNLRSTGATSPNDYSRTVFTADLDPVALPAGSRVLVRVTGAGSAREGGFIALDDAGSARFAQPGLVDGRLVVPRWGDGGLEFEIVCEPVLVTGLAVAGRQVSIGVRGPRPQQARLVGPQPIELEVGRAEQGWLLTAELPGLDGTDAERDDWTPRPPSGAGPPLGQRLWLVEVESGGVVRPVRWLADVPAPDAAGEVSFDLGDEGSLRVLQAGASLLVEAAEVVDPANPRLAVKGRAFGAVEGARIVLTGRREELAGELRLAGDGSFAAEIPLLRSVWGTTPTPPMMGTYVLGGRTADGTGFAARVDHGLLARAPWGALSEWFRHRLELAAGKALALRLNRPLRDDELGTAAQARLEAEYRAGEFPALDAVYLESFYERMATCNPLALDRALAERYPNLPRYWGVRDRSVLVPPGAIPVVDGTREWWAARGGCRWVITNDWLRARFHRQPHQVVLQTWHGTMYKKIGLDLERTTDEVKPKFLHERSLWNLLLSQNPHSSEVFRSAYAWDGPLIEEGYPRNDPLTDGSGAPVRELLGVAPDKTVVLYAPTWRDDQTELATFLDVDELSAALGPQYVVLLRAHSRTIRYGGAARVGSAVIDVTTHPSITDLFLATDILVTDYSSVMFDFSVTGRPMVFFVPDLTAYDEIRGSYFRLADSAPGPIVTTQAEVIRAIQRAREDEPRYAERYRAWRERFNPWDDGHSAERVLKVLFAAEPPAAR